MTLDLDGLTEGDMAIPQEAALKRGYKQWPNGFVPYTLTSNFSKILIRSFDKIRCFSYIL